MVRSGEINFSSIHGEMYLHDNVVVTTINTVNVWEKVLNFLTGMVDRVTFATSRLTAQVPGRYLVQATISSASAAVNQTLEIGIAKNGTVVDKTTIPRRYGTTDIGAKCGSRSY